MFLVGLTGGIASGKSTVSKILSDLGCPIIDADLISREVVEVGRPGWLKVREVFGADICLADGKLDRVKLGQIIFADAEQRKLLNSIVHPLVRREMLWRVLKYFLRGYRYIILDIPLLLENKAMMPVLSEVAVVYCAHEVQLSRLMARNELSEEDALQRMSAQLPLDSKKSMVTNPVCLIDNNGDINDTNSQVIQLKQYLDRSWRPELLRSLIGLVVLIIGYFSI